MANTTNTTPSLGAKTGTGANSTTKAAVFGYILGLATAGILYLVSGKGKRSEPRRSDRPKLYYERPLVPPSTPSVDAHDNEGMTDVTLPTEPTALAPVGQAKLSDEDVETIRAMKDAGKSVKEIASLYGVSPKTVYARLHKAKSHPQNEMNDGREAE